MEVPVGYLLVLCFYHICNMFHCIFQSGLESQTQSQEPSIIHYSHVRFHEHDSAWKAIMRLNWLKFVLNLQIKYVQWKGCKDTFTNYQHLNILLFFFLFSSGYSCSYEETYPLQNFRPSLAFIVSMEAFSGQPIPCSSLYAYFNSTDTA